MVSLNPLQRVQAMHAAERARRDGALRPGELPLSYDELTPDWLTAVLCMGFPQARVTALRLVPTDSGTSNRCRIVVDYNRAGRDAALPTQFFCKASHEPMNRLVLGVSGGARVECHFYNAIRPALHIAAPVAYFARFDEASYNSLVMLGDLTDSAQAFCTPTTAITLERARSQMRLLAAMHGRSHGDAPLRQALAPLPTWPAFFAATQDFGLRAGAEQGFLAAEAVIPPRLFRQRSAFWPAVVAAVEGHGELPQVLSHGDVHLKNWYVAANGEMGLSDWQCCSRGHWGRDLAYTLATALSVDDRRAWEQALIREYLDLLAAEGGPATGFDEALMHYRQQMISVLPWWTVTLTPPPGMPEMQPRDHTLEFIRRIAIAIDDLDAMRIHTPRVVVPALRASSADRGS